jgi:hypothetical protein
MVTVTILLGLITLLPGITTDPMTASTSDFYGISIFLSGLVQSRRSHNCILLKESPELKCNDSKDVSILKRRHPYTLSLASVDHAPEFSYYSLGALLFPIIRVLIYSISADGELGLLLVIMAIQMTALGETPIGEYKRSWLLVSIGFVFALLWELSHDTSQES